VTSRPVTLALLTTLAIPMTALSQDRAECSFDTAAHIRLDTLILGLAPAGRDLPREVRADYLNAAEAIREQFDRPAMLRLPLAARVVPKKKKEPSTSVPQYGLHGIIRFQLDTTGRLASEAIMVGSASPDIAEAIVSAIRRADSAYAFLPPSKPLRERNGEIQLRFVDTTRMKDPSVALIRLIVPGVVADGEPSRISFPEVRYPDNLRLMGVDGRVVVEFIIRTDSVVDPGSVQILESSHHDFEALALEGLKLARYRPAKIGGCLVPVLVRQPVDFKLRRAEITGTVRTMPY